ncbi:MAG: hypothetical protein V4722_20030 [Bacteroidota bacterium]
METTQQEAADQVYAHAANLMVHQKMSHQDVQIALVEKGLDAESAATVVTNLGTEIRAIKKDRAQKDMLYGALWCIGGTVATLAEVGFIFWGAIVFGGIQFFKGVANSFDKD